MSLKSCPQGHLELFHELGFNQMLLLVVIILMGKSNLWSLTRPSALHSMSLAILSLAAPRLYGIQTPKSQTS